jgi:hypothetical protein
VLCQVLPSELSVPDTAPPPGAATVTLVTLPLVAVTVIPAEGLTPWLPVAGVIFSSEASSAACALAAAEAEAAAAADADAAEAEAWAGVCGGALLQAAVSSPITSAATTLA